MVKDRVRLPMTFDKFRMQAGVARLARTDWIEHFGTDHYRGSWSVVPLRAPAHARDPIQMIFVDPACEQFADTTVLDGQPYFREILRAFQCPIESVRLMRLAPASEIKEHCDRDAALERGRARIHIPVVTNPQTSFYLNGSKVPMREGESWYLRLCDPHAARNDGSDDRIHLVIDAIVDAWLRRLLDAM
jgi:hypothetical protein